MALSFVDTWVLPYIDAHLDEGKYLTAVLRRFGARNVVDAIAGELGKRWDKPDEVFRLLTFLRDGAIGSSLPNALREELGREIQTSGVYDAIREGLRCASHYSRAHCIYFVGKLQHEGRGQLLLDALPFYLERDPLNMDRMMFELFWLHAAPKQELLERVCRHTHFLWRWSVMRWLEVEHMARPLDTPEVVAWRAWQRQRLQVLLSDEAPEIRAEARWLWELAQYREQSGTIEKRPRLRQLRELKRQFEPPMRHFMLENWFAHWRPKQTTYTVRELEQFVREVWPVMLLEHAERRDGPSTRTDLETDDR